MIPEEKVDEKIVDKNVASDIQEEKIRNQIEAEIDIATEKATKEIMENFVLNRRTLDNKDLISQMKKDYYFERAAEYTITAGASVFVAFIIFKLFFED